MSESARPPHCCIECGETTGWIQHVDVAWPGGKHWEGWLHPDCEAEALERIEKIQR